MGQGYAGLLGPLPLWAPPTKKTLETGDRQPQDGRSMGLRMTMESCPLTKTSTLGFTREKNLGKVMQLHPNFLMSRTCNSA